MRPIHVPTAEHTRGHVLVVMLAYLIRRDLSRAWASLDATVEEGLHQLQTLCVTEVKVEGGGSCLRIPTPSVAAALLKALKIRLPEALPHTETMKKIARVLRAHRELPLNYFKAKREFSSGVVEGLNNKAKGTMKKSYGFRAFRITELALYHALGKSPGTVWAFNLNRWDGVEPNRRMSIWSDSMQERPGPHAPERFGDMRFVQ